MSSAGDTEDEYDESVSSRSSDEDSDDLDGDDSEEDEEFEDDIKMVQDVLEKVIIRGDDRKTRDVITAEEYARVIAMRATHIANQQRSYLPPELTPSDSLEIAKEEIRQGLCPLSIRRLLYEKDGKEYVEEWAVNELTIPY
jgi:DNA-directed RNA polymerase subunit K/omega